MPTQADETIFVIRRSHPETTSARMTVDQTTSAITLAVYSEAINVTVTESGRPPKKRYKRHRRWRYY